MTKEELEELDDEEVVELWNDFCENNNMYDDRIYRMEEIDDWLGKMYPTDLFDTIDFDNFKASDNYISRDGYGYLESLDNPYETIDEKALLEWYNENLS